MKAKKPKQNALLSIPHDDYIGILKEISRMFSVLTEGQNKLIEIFDKHERRRQMRELAEVRRSVKV